MTVTVDIMSLVMSTEHVTLVGIGLGVLQSVLKVFMSGYPVITSRSTSNNKKYRTKLSNLTFNML